MASRRFKAPVLRGKIDEEWLKKRLFYAFLKAKKRKSKTADECNFEMNFMENIQRLVDDILDGKYHPSPGVAFIVEKPVKREIFAAPFRDRVVHHFLHDQCVDWWDRRLIYNSFSCRKGKGTLFGVKRMEHDIRSVSQNYTKEAYIIKMDIQGYFMSLSREKLYERVKWGLDRQLKKSTHKHKLMRYLWREVIFDDPTVGVMKRPPYSAWNGLPNSKSLFHQPEGQGVVIGNLSSQLLSNIYMDTFDRFVTKTLGYKHYGRYVDDFYIVVPKEDLKKAIRHIEVMRDYLAGMGLIMHPNKLYIQEVKKGVSFLGMVIYPFGIVAGKRFKQNFYQATLAYSMGNREDETIISYLGWLKHIRGKKLCHKIFAKVGWDYQY